MRVLLVEPYFGGSHQAWAEGYQAASRHEVRLLTLPARWWRWRMRGAALTLSEGVAEMTAAGWTPTVVLVSDMVDLPALQAFTRRTLSDVPFVLYFHESQLTYPDSPLAEPDLSYAVTNWLSAVAADHVLFNSEFHRRVFFSQLPRLLRRFPDYTHLHRVREVEGRAQVLPVGVDLSWVEPGGGGEPPLVVWNHR